MVNDPIQRDLHAYAIGGLSIVVVLTCTLAAFALLLQAKQASVERTMTVPHQCALQGAAGWYEWSDGHVTCVMRKYPAQDRD